MTKVTTLEDLLQGNQQEQPKKTPIRFFKRLTLKGEVVVDPFVVPKIYENLVLLKKGLGLEFDLILAYSNIKNPTVYLGHWNDGVVE